MKKKLAISCVMTIFWLHAAGQFNTVDLVPDRTGSPEESRDFYYCASVSGMMPFDERKNDFQKSRLGQKDPRAGIWRGEIQMGYFLSGARNRMIEPIVRFHLDGMPMHFMSSSFGLGFVFRPLELGAGVFYGEYYRQVASGGNFVTRRSKQFDNYSMRGFYLELANKQASFFFSTTVEEKKTVVLARVAGRFGNILSLGQNGGTLRSFEIVLESREFSGSGAGLSMQVFPQTRLQVLWVAPTKLDRNEQSRLGNVVSHGVLVSLSVCVN